ncbi:5847f4cd-d96a-4afe-8d4b-3e3ceafb6f26 [Thermothielavioides terrestris]|uniref:5847f4cd-d96a-4afe-8d4b-3e3ceafb6f26 n=1 Tax=Thermothielavioides terrestris TaxID=2587410 RepID=A0A3S4F0Y0_9PEZI|nr:5847f4cd-d96a-4afe-8d4b-3e3ceafb6f26 [Thermothielavioides terrestris]
MRASTLHCLLALAVAAQAAPTRGGSEFANLKAHIKNVVILVMENRSLDNLLGGQKLKGIDNPIQKGPFCNPYNLTNPAAGLVCSAANDFDSITDDPDHAVYGNNIEFYGTFTPDNNAIASGHLTPTQKGFVHEQLRLYSSKANRSTLAQQVMNYYTEEQVPVLTALIKNFVTFNHWHSAIPGPTDPNRLALVSGSSYGHGSNDATFTAKGFNEKSIFQSLTEGGYHWRNYHDPAGGTGPEASWFQWTYDAGLEGNVVDISQFFVDAAAGNLTSLSFINPSCCGVGTTSMHPSGLISAGEALIKQVYEALRAGPQWEQTLFILTFDETGGFHDHVPPPLAPRPDDLTYTATTPSGANYTFPFNRLGGRIPTLLISPWVSKGYVEQQHANSAGQVVSYSATSILRTLGYLFDFEPYNPRVEWSPSFAHLINSRARNTPKKLPAANPFKE